MGINVQGVNLSSILHRLHILKCRASRPEPIKIIREDLAIRASRKNGRVAMPLDVLNGQLIRNGRRPSRLRQRRLRRNQDAKIEAIIYLQPVHRDGLEDMPTGEHDSTAIGRRVET